MLVPFKNVQIEYLSVLTYYKGKLKRKENSYRKEKKYSSEMALINNVNIGYIYTFICAIVFALSFYLKEELQ